MQRVRDGEAVFVFWPLRFWPQCWGRHRWQVFQHNVEANEDIRCVFVICWKQCVRCGKSKLMHIVQ
jgi:hypothetical protein